MKILTVFVLILMFPITGFAFNDAKSKLNLANELAICAGYFFVGSEAAKKSGDKALVEDIKKTADAALISAIKLSNKEKATSTLQRAIKDHQLLINNNTANIGILIRKYKALCKNILSNQQKRYEYWLKQK